MKPNKLKSVGVCCWNMWGDANVDRPDNSDEVILTNIVMWLANHNWLRHVFQFQKMDVVDKNDFRGIGASERYEVYDDILVQCQPNSAAPDLDLLLLKWRWDLGDPNDERLVRQRQTLDRYIDTDTKIVIWDDDFAMTQAEIDEMLSHKNVSIVEVSERARTGGSRKIYVPYPMHIDRELALSRVLGRAGSGCGDFIDDTMLLAYVGNNYKREEYIKEYIDFTACYYPGNTHFYGNWLKYDTCVTKRHPFIVFHPKVGREQFAWIYAHAHAVPMLAKEEYFDVGHITPRMHEVIMSGGYPLGFEEFRNAPRYFADTVQDSQQLLARVEQISQMGYEDRKRAISEQIDLLIGNKVFDVDEFFRCIFEAM